MSNFGNWVIEKGRKSFRGYKGRSPWLVGPGRAFFPFSGIVWIRKIMSPAFAGSQLAFIAYPQLALWARRISPASLAWCSYGAGNNRGLKKTHEISLA